MSSARGEAGNLGAGAGRFRSFVSAWPVRRRSTPLQAFLRYPTTPLSVRATAGFLARAELGTLNFPPGFLPAVRAHLRRMRVLERG